MVPVALQGASSNSFATGRSGRQALARLAPPVVEAVPALQGALTDPDRYVRFFAALALRRMGTPEALEVLLDHLFTARWCPITGQGSPY